MTKIATSWEKDELIAAGLGENKVVFEDVDCDADQFREALFSCFPKLKDCGGYQLCKCKPNSRELQPLSGAVHLKLYKPVVVIQGHIFALYKPT